jgi:hypothetical protein
MALAKRREAMWLWESELRELGFRRKSDRYWQCERRFGLEDDEHLSIFSWSEQAIPSSASGPARFLVELTEFHLTFRIQCDHVHFYYHERLENEWFPEGHTSSTEIRRLGQDPLALRSRADQIASAFVAALGGACNAR